MSARTKNLTLFLYLPGGICLALIAMYFSGVDALQRIVSPNLPRMHRGMGREFGLLENLQHILILVIAGMAIWGVKKKEWKWERIGWGLVAAFSIFVFLEEIDYGIHYYEYANEITLLESQKVRNLHNQGDVTDYMKNVVDIGIILLFVVAPFIGRRSAKPLIRYISPSAWFTVLAVLMVALSELAHGLREAGFGKGGTINKNLSEFRELIIYYTFMLYVFETVYRKRLEAPEAEAAEMATTVRTAS